MKQEKTTHRDACEYAAESIETMEHRENDEAEAKRKHAVLFVIGAAVRCLWIKRERGDSSTVSRREG